MFGRYVIINCLYTKEPIEVWVLCNPSDSMEVLKQRARQIVKNQMEKQIEENYSSRIKG